MRSTDEALDKCGMEVGLRRSKRKAEEAAVCDTGEDDDDFVTLDVLHKIGKSSHLDLKIEVPGKMEIDGSFHVSVRGYPGERPCKLTRVDEGSTEEVSACISYLQSDKEKEISTLRNKFRLPSNVGRSCLQTTLPWFLKCPNRLDGVLVQYGDAEDVTEWGPSHTNPLVLQCHTLEVLEISRPVNSTKRRISRRTLQMKENLLW